MNLAQWLERITQVHPVKWDLGLERVRAVAERLGVLQPAKQVILVAGTNGKGSTCECLAKLCQSLGLKYGKTSSPFLRSYNEQFDINGRLASEAEIVNAFDLIDKARGEITLTYFEFSALAAFVLFDTADLDIAIVEIGLGGRLDAMNILSPDVSIITSIDLDHQDYLGSDREAIGFEKAGILRAEKAAVIVDEKPPVSVLAEIRRLNCDSLILGDKLCLRGQDLSLGDRRVRLPDSPLHILSRAAAVAALWQLAYFPSQDQLDTALTGLTLEGRFQQIAGPPPLILDVAHNPAAAVCLAQRLQTAGFTSCHGIVAIFADKDISQVFSILSPYLKTWHLVDLGLARSASVRQMQDVLQGLTSASGANFQVQVYRSIALAYDGAAASGGPEPILVFGSFPVVAGVLKHLDDIDVC